MPSGPLTWNGDRFAKDANGNYRFVYSGKDAQAGRNINAIILEVPTLLGMLEVLAIPYTHSGVLSSALAMQKDVAKDLLRAAGVPVPEGRVASRFEAGNRSA